MCECNCGTDECDTPNVCEFCFCCPSCCECIDESTCESDFYEDYF